MTTLSRSKKHEFIFIYMSMFHTISCFPASRIQWMLSLYCCRTFSVTVVLISSSTAAAIASVSDRSAGSPEVHTQRNGPKPSEKISLQIKANISHSMCAYACALQVVTYPIMCWMYEGYLNTVAPPPFFSTSAPYRKPTHFIGCFLKSYIMIFLSFL